jgi:hypothetical protein
VWSRTMRAEFLDISPMSSAVVSLLFLNLYRELFSSDRLTILVLMAKSLIQVGLVDTTGALDSALLEATAAAVNVQVMRDFSQFWNVQATVG